MKVLIEKCRLCKQNHGDFLPEKSELEKPLIEENLVQNEIHFTEEDFPPVSSISTTLEQTFNQAEGKQSIPSEIEDVLRNKTFT